ncbi:cAMP-binding domain of CRP or a regulatory subunit of cAMP-dependent protein kinases [Dyadobacter sp. SG02]|uniref:Crp/Fnr family transcriptional regulator n=1 Tax=Dyadobacter sp. SG02 TaxID=1855291 RepID=UPI0008C4D2A0|nr:Crp/Fnr family transcriptional regulator [Dyadobacter sp. SG02]SEJ58279.1 cAMP-binding domain of CRP or a regulatory subunit of cAMP-dependent protein kinases [Dyadobacter sp. SG02]
MHTEFENYLASQTDLSGETIRHIGSMATMRKLHKNEALLTSGEICRHKVFIINGMLRSYYLRTDGSEHILQFSPQLTWTLDVESYDKQTPSLVNIEAVEKTEVLLWAKPDFDKLLKEIPELKTFSERLIARTIYHNRNRILTILSGTPEERYLEFVNTYPDYLARLPLRMVAAYLGISLKTLTRIRHAQLQREAGIMDK